MPAGFASPGILFLNTWDSPERSFSRSVFKAMRDRGYTRYVELCSGAFAMPLVAQNGGWKPGEMEASDVSLYTAIVGTMLAGDDLAKLDIRVDGEATELPDSPVNQAAYLLWLQLLVRMETGKSAEHPYFRGIVADLRDRSGEHQADIRRRLVELDERLHGIHYRPMDMFDHLAEVVDDPHTLINTNPPTYRAGFEKFFDTKGRLTWAEPTYEIFDPLTGVDRIIRETKDKAALLLCLEQREPGGSSHEMPVYARHLSFGQNVYLFSNRPDELFQVTGGPRVSPKRTQPLEPLPNPILGKRAEIRPDAAVELLPIKPATAEYYRHLWMHRMKTTTGPMNIAVLVDGHVAGVLGYDHDTMVHPRESRPLDSPVERYIKLRYAFGCPHDTYRITRLVTMAAMRRGTIERLLTGINSLVLQASRGLLTVEYTKYPEAKGLRGIMKLVDRRDSKKVKGQKELFYTGDWVDETIDETLARFLRKESQWQKARNASR